MECPEQYRRRDMRPSKKDLGCSRLEGRLCFHRNRHYGHHPRCDKTTPGHPATIADCLRRLWRPATSPCSPQGMDARRPHSCPTHWRHMPSIAHRVKSSAEPLYTFPCSSGFRFVVAFHRQHSDVPSSGSVRHIPARPGFSHRLTRDHGKSCSIRCRTKLLVLSRAIGCLPVDAAVFRSLARQKSDPFAIRGPKRLIVCRLHRRSAGSWFCEQGPRSRCLLFSPVPMVKATLVPSGDILG